MNQSLQERFAPKNRCFGCGPANDLGLRIRSVPQGELVVADWTPDEAAIEETFMNNNAASALKLGHARAAALLAPAKAGLPVAEYAARVVKKSVVGTGAADKDQVAFMIARILPGSAGATADAADALAVAVAHAHARTRGRLAA